MKVVITGASGSVGTALLHTVRAEGCEVVGVVRRPPPADCPPYTGVRWVRCDIGDPAALPQLTHACTGADALVHLAWAINPRTGDPPMERTNRVGTANVLQAAAACGVAHLTCASSVATCTPTARWRRVDERWPLDGITTSAYSRGKVVLEQQLDAFARANPSLRIARIRPCAVAQGAAAAEIADWVLSPWLARAVIGHRLLPVPLWRDLRLQLVHAEDVAAAIWLIVRERATGAFGLAAEPVLSAPVLATIFGGFRLPVPRPVLAAAAWAGWRLGLQPLHPGWLDLADQACLVDAGRAHRELGWSPKHDAIAVATELAAGFRAHRRGDSPALAPPRVPFHFGSPTHQSQAPPRRAGP
ncbi:NAD-dependent epimerase/dehydratase family protein [Nocardia coubleae]|uniref:NAD-dependent epimerase/dehydratase family protein n=1 Tax=Nocardia coubleae TaxID=356147 RepID=A0A846VZY6_9NOCA|nr:NAD-dependent epimerase/dehydratase family protein [Nocardia coubleae]NKX86007.1 NAD-dependent epimerase/dehydratase family protein [Nocardia coubleae]